MSPQGTELPIPTAYMISWLAAQAGPRNKAAIRRQAIQTEISLGSKLN